MDTEERISVPNGVPPFERIRRTNAGGAEYWSSRDFAQVLGYSDHRNFEQATEKAKTACFNSGQRIKDHFVEITEMIFHYMGRIRACPHRLRDYAEEGGPSSESGPKWDLGFALYSALLGCIIIRTPEFGGKTKPAYRGHLAAFRQVWAPTGGCGAEFGDGFCAILVAPRSPSGYR
jgi:hypothetical protein